MTYNRDLQEDKRGLFASLDGVEQVLEILPPLLDGIAIDEDRALAGFRDGLALATDVAEYLVVRGVPFRLAHEKVGKLVHWCLESRRDLPSLSLAEWQSLIPEVEEDLLPCWTCGCPWTEEDLRGYGDLGASPAEGRGKAQPAGLDQSLDPSGPFP
jgi:argininosuccinate lyase